MNAGQHPGCGHLLSKRGGLTQRGLVDVGRLLLGNVCLNFCVCVCNSGTASLQHLQRTMRLVTPESDLPMMWHRPVVHVELVVLSLVLFLFFSSCSLQAPSEKRRRLRGKLIPSLAQYDALLFLVL